MLRKAFARFVQFFTPEDECDKEAIAVISAVSVGIWLVVSLLFMPVAGAWSPVVIGLSLMAVALGSAVAVFVGCLVREILE